MKINLIAHENGYGLSRDVEIFDEVLHDLGHEAYHLDPLHIPELLGTADANIFFEVVEPSCFAAAKHQVLIPNPEWPGSWISYMPRLHVWCKTLSAFETLTKLKMVIDPARGSEGFKQIEYLGFTSRDRFDETVERKREFLHLAGHSSMRSTDVVLEAWLRNPKWPKLTVVWDEKKLSRFAREFIEKPIRNVEIYGYRLSGREVRELQNSCLFHLCPSECEGFGHYMNEALSVGAVVLSLNAPPMSEIVPPDVGHLIMPNGCRKFRFVQRYSVLVDTLEAGVRHLLALPVTPRVEARKLFLARDATVRLRIKHLLSDLVDTSRFQVVTP